MEIETIFGMIKAVVEEIIIVLGNLATIILAVYTYLDSKKGK